VATIGRGSPPPSKPTIYEKINDESLEVHDLCQFKAFLLFRKKFPLVLHQYQLRGFQIDVASLGNGLLLVGMIGMEV